MKHRKSQATYLITEYEIANNPTNAPDLSKTPYDLHRSRQTTVKEDYIKTF